MQRETMSERMGLTIKRVLILSLALFGILAKKAYAVPETAGVRIVDVTPTSFSMVWLTDTAADPALEVYSDNAMVEEITARLVVTPLPAASARVAAAAKSKGIMKVRASGLNPSSIYYARTVTKDSTNPQSVSYSALLEVVTASRVAPYIDRNGLSQGFSNDLLAVQVYLRPQDTNPEPELGDLVLLERDGSLAPLSTFVGDSIGSAEGIIDLNNLFGAQAVNLDLLGEEKIILMIYRAGGLSALSHYRKVAPDMNLVSVVDPMKGFFADINLDGNVDSLDFDEFRNQYRTGPNDASFNPDYDFVEDASGQVDARDFSKFSREYGRTNVP